ncbi:hypothetical protein ID867_02885 [Streptomyces parvulus]|nr:hypothetical protein [Streptomyces parvulus]
MIRTLRSQPSRRSGTRPVRQASASWAATTRPSTVLKWGSRSAPAAFFDQSAGYLTPTEDAARTVPSAARVRRSSPMS